MHHQSNIFRQKYSHNDNRVTAQENNGNAGPVRVVWSYRCEATRSICTRVRDRVRVRVRVSVLLPLQSTKDYVHTTRTIDIGCHKQWVVYAYIY